ncbi:hypothetical protein ABZV65_19740 [Streptomyces bauhiniae]|uniref:hypothetical protein n=1 Tax=Streptomyces bauhiniae TaxID=2340725 RepID=UPI0033B41F40
MTAVQTVVTEAELADWLTTDIGPRIDNHHHTATRLLTAFDFKAKDSNSLNNQQQIADCLSPQPIRWPEPFIPLTTEAAAQHLLIAFRVTRKPANYDRLFVDLPMPVVVSRHQCPFCRRFTRADLSQVQDHMTRCWQNPRLRTCKTCAHYQPESTDFRHQCHPGYHCGCNDWDESCTHPEGPESEDYQFPVLHCPLWQSKTDKETAA